MPDFNYSPWGAAAASVGGVSDSFNNAALGIARLRYLQAVEQQREALQMGHLALQQQIGRAQIAHYGAQTDESAALARLHGAQTDAAAPFANAYGRAMSPQVASEGPSIANAGRMSLQDMYRQAGLVQALHGNVAPLVQGANIGQNQVRVGPTGNLIGVGPTILNPGQEVSMPGMAPRQLDKMVPVAPGYTPYSLITSKQTGDTAPYAPQARQANFLPAAINGYLAGDFDEDPRTKKEIGMFLESFFKAQNAQSGTNAPVRPRLFVPSPVVPTNAVPSVAPTNAPPASAAPVSASATNEVRRITKDGRTAIFNADTKEFLRYAE